MDAMQLLDAKKAELTKRVAKLRSQLKAAEDELQKIEITSDTLTRLGINPDIEPSIPRGQSLSYVLENLPSSLEEALTPKEIYERLLARGLTGISQDNVRAILSRNKDKICNEDGRYWKDMDSELGPSAASAADGPKHDGQKEETEW